MRKFHQQINLWLGLVFHPLYWSPRLRLAFLLTLPIALALWILIVVCLVALLALVSIIEALTYFLTAPQRRRSSRGNWGRSARRY
ncbi:MAG: hypothetical protein KGJ05_02210 [Alphaproteobacteria bacterium]|nr:hypothetical protein [Alphaproteobacteria bacterium]MDE2341608.1 hypothetical protein [Alphaproteobacteria bacterium]